MSKKVLSILLIAVMLVAMVCVGAVSASATTTGRIYFTLPESWGEFEYTGSGRMKTSVYAHIWVNGGEDYAAWQSQAEKMTQVGDTRQFYFDIANEPVEGGDWNLIIVSCVQPDAGLNNQSYDLTMGPECMGDEIYLTGNLIENPMDSAQTAQEAMWRNSPTQGPKLAITSLGNIVGTTPLPGETPESIVTAWAANYPALATDEVVADLTARLETIFAELPTLPTGTEPSDQPTQPTDEPEPTQPTDEPEPTQPTDTPEPTQPTDTPEPTNPTDPTDTAPTDSPTDEYGRTRGIPSPYKVRMPERMMANNGQPGDEAHPDWDGYYKVFYFEAPDEWLANADKKEEGYEIGFYWYNGTENNGEWPGVPATQLLPTMIEKFKDENPDATEEELAAAEAELAAAYGNIYYAIAPSYVPFILWNNGVDKGLPTDEDYDESKQDIAYQTVDINTDDPILNDLEAADLCGTMTVLTGEVTEEENQLTGIVNRLHKTTQVFFNPLTGAQTTEPFTIDGEVQYTEDGYTQNPYFDMDYTYIRNDAANVTPVEPGTSSVMETEPATTTGGASTTTDGKAPGTVNTAQDIVMFVVLATVLVAAAGVVVIARKRKEQV